MTEQALVAAPTVLAPKAEHLMGRLWRHRSGRLALLMLGALALVVVVGPILVRHNATSDLLYQNLAQALKLPSRERLLGTDQLGRDELVRLILGAKYTLFIGVGAV